MVDEHVNESAPTMESNPAPPRIDRGRSQLTKEQRSERDRRIVLLHMAGVSYREIGERLGCSAQTAFIAVKVAESKPFAAVSLSADGASNVLTLHCDTIERMRIVYTAIEHALSKLGIPVQRVPDVRSGTQGPSGQSASEEGGGS